MTEAQGRDAIFECREVGLELPSSGRRILDGITLDVRRGEFLTVVGGSGTGKTSLLRVLGGLVPVSSGLLRFRGQPVVGPPDGVAIVFQDYARALLQWRTVGGNVALGLEGRVRRGELRDRVAAALTLVSLERRADDYPWQLSGGMQQRVQIARALALQPAILLMDEPFGALDAMTKAALQDEMLRVHERTGASFVFITHDIEEAAYLGDRVIVLGGPPGRIHCEMEVCLPRPRHQIATRQLPEFLALRAEIHSEIEKSEPGVHAAT